MIAHRSESEELPLSYPNHVWRSGYFRKFKEQFFANLPENEDEDQEDEAELVEISGVDPTVQEFPWGTHP